jgi:hypothetical protein
MSAPLPDTEYEILIGTRGKGVGKIAMERLRVKNAWGGCCYRWVNLNKEDNKGRCRQSDYLVSYEEGSSVIPWAF